MTTNSPCDISASEYNRIFQERNNYLQSISVPPYYGTPNAVPERARTCTLQNGSIINLAKGNITQAKYKNDVLSTYNKNTYVATKTERLKRVFNGFTSNGQQSAQYGTQNWNYTEPDSRQSNLLGNNTLTCDIPSGFNKWLSVITDSSGEIFIANQISSSYYNIINKSWYLSSPSLSLTNNQFLTNSNNNTYISGTNYIYRSTDNGVTWDINNSYEYPKTGIKGIRQIRSIITDLSGEKYSIVGENSLGTTIIVVEYTGNTISLIKDYSRYLPHSDFPNSTNNNVYFTSMDSYQDVSNNINIWACGYCNPSYIPSRYYDIITQTYYDTGYTEPITGNYLWYSNDNGINWSNGINIETGIIGNAAQGPENQFWTGIDVSLTNIKVSKDGTTVVVSGNNKLNKSEPNFWINTISGELSGWGLTSSNNGFSNITQVYDWYKIAVSANGMIIIASSVEREDFGNTGYIYISRDKGVTVKRGKLPLAVWNSISISDDGLTIIVSSNSLQFKPNSINLLDGGYVYISKDGGITWTKQVFQ